MNFVAGISPSSLPLGQEWFDNSGDDHPLPLHPLFLASTREIIGAWAALYSTDVTKEEVIAHTFVHHSFDAVFHREAVVDRTYRTDVTLVGVGARRSGGHFVTECTNCHVDGGRRPIGTSWWGGIVLGLPVEGADRHMDGRMPPPRPQRPAGVSTTTTIVIPPSQAHLFDACIRDPRHPKAKSSDINVHTNVAFAKKAGLDGRTLNGLALLGYVLPFLARHAGKEVRRLSSVGVTFGAPVMLAWEPVALSLHMLAIVPAGGDKLTVHFEVKTGEGGRAIRDGFVSWDEEAEKPCSKL